MKKIRLISSMLCVLLAFGTIFGVTVSAQENKISFVTVEKQYLAGAKSVSNVELDKAIVDGWNSMKESIIYPLTTLRIIISILFIIIPNISM